MQIDFFELYFIFLCGSLVKYIKLLIIMDKLVIVGIGSVTPDVIHFVRKYKLYEIVGFSVDKKYLVPKYLELPVYPLEELDLYVNKEEVKVFVAISWYNQLMRFKREKFEYLKSKGFHFANLISPLSSVNTESIGEGNWINDFVEIGSYAIIGDNNIVRSQSIIGHDTKMGSHNTLSGRAMVGGDNVIGDQNYFGINCTVFNKLNIGNKCIVGGGSVCKKDLCDYSIVTCPSSHYKIGTEKLNYFIMSPKGQNAVKELL